MTSSTSTTLCRLRSSLSRLVTTWVDADYGSGLERFVVTTLLIGDQELGPGGAFAGTVATVGLASDDTPYLWLRSKDGVVVTLRGATTVDQLSSPPPTPSPR